MWSHIGFLGHDGKNDSHIVESSSNLVELPDCFDGSYGNGVEALGARDKIQSGLYNAVAVRPLVAPSAAAQAAWNASMWSTYFLFQQVPYEFETTGKLPLSVTGTVDTHAAPHMLPVSQRCFLAHSTGTITRIAPASSALNSQRRPCSEQMC